MVGMIFALGWIVVALLVFILAPKFDQNPMMGVLIVAGVGLFIIAFPSIISMFTNRGLSIVGVGEGRLNVDNLGANIDGVSYVYRGGRLHYWSRAVINKDCNNPQWVGGFILPMDLCRGNHLFELYFGDVVEDDPSPAWVDFVYAEPSDNTVRLTVTAKIEDRTFTHQYYVIAQPWTTQGFKVTKSGNIDDFNSDVTFEFIGERPSNYRLNVLGFSIRAVGTNVVLKWCENMGETVPFNFWTEERCGSIPEITPPPTSIVVTATPPPVDTGFPPPPATFPPTTLPPQEGTGVCGPTLILLMMVAIPLVGKKFGVI